MKKIKVIAAILAACMGIAAFGLAVHMDAEKHMDTEKTMGAEKIEEDSGGERLAMMYEERKTEAQAKKAQAEKAEAEMEQAQKKSEAQQGAVAAYDAIEKAMTVHSNPGESVVYLEEYAGAYINDNHTLVVCVTTEDMAQNIEENIVGRLSGEEARLAEDVMAGDIEYRVVAHSYNELAGIQDEISDAYEKLYPAYGEGTPEYELLDTITGIGLNQEKNVVTVEIDELSEQKIMAFVSLFGDYDCVEFEEGALAQDD